MRWEAPQGSVLRIHEGVKKVRGSVAAPLTEGSEAPKGSVLGSCKKVRMLQGKEAEPTRLEMFLMECIKTLGEMVRDGEV